MLLAGLNRATGVAIPVLGTGLTAAALLAIAGVLLAASRAGGREAEGWLGGTLVVASAYVWLGQGAGPLPALALLLAAARTAGSRRPWLAGAVAGLACCCRPDAALGAALLTVLLAAESRPSAASGAAHPAARLVRPLIFAAAFAAVAALALAAAWAYFGTPLAGLHRTRLLAPGAAVFLRLRRVLRAGAPAAGRGGAGAAVRAGRPAGQAARPLLAGAGCLLHAGRGPVLHLVHHPDRRRRPVRRALPGGSARSPRPGRRREAARGAASGVAGGGPDAGRPRRRRHAVSPGCRRSLVAAGRHRRLAPLCLRPSGRVDSRPYAARRRRRRRGGRHPGLLQRSPRRRPHRTGHPACPPLCRRRRSPGRLPRQAHGAGAVSHL